MTDREKNELKEIVRHTYCLMVGREGEVNREVIKQLDKMNNILNETS